MTRPTIDQFMTKSPHTIARHQTLSKAHQMMKDLGIRHLPVLEGGRLVGLVSQRDLLFIETMQIVDEEEVTVGDAMSTELYTVGPKVTLKTVASEMAEKKYGSAVVLDGGKVVGVFTTTDALEVLASVLTEVGRRTA